MQQNERKSSRTQSPRGRSPSGRTSRWSCKDYLKGTCTNSFCQKWHPPKCWFYKTKSGCRLGEKCSYAHRQIDEQASKRSMNGDKCAVVVMLKKHELYDRTGKPVVCYDTSRAPRTYCVQLIKYTTIGLCISRHDAAEAYSPEEHRHAETNPNEGSCTSRKKSRQKSFALNDLPR